MTHEFWRAWPSTEDDDAFVRYPAKALEPFGLDSDDVALLADAGLPAWAAPHLNFFAGSDAQLSPPEDPYGRPYPSILTGVAMIGAAEDGWPLCLDRGRPGQVLWWHPSEAPEGILVNSSPRQLALALLAYGCAVEKALSHGAAAGEEDAWRRRRYPPEIDQQLWEELQAIDPAIADHGSFWERHFSLRAADT